MNTRLSIAMMMVAVQGCAAGGQPEVEVAAELGDSGCDTTQIYGNGQHTGKRCGPLPAMNLMGTVTQDPDAAQENADNGFLPVHYGSVLTRGTWFYVPDKSGYTDPDNKDSQTWGVTAYRWIGDAPVVQWHYASRWQPLDAINPFGGTTAGYESLFQPALVGDTLYVPSAAGRVVKLSASTGDVLGEVNALAGTPYDGDPATIVSSAIAHQDEIGSANIGQIAYTVVAWDPSGSRNIAPRESWLVTVNPNGSVNKATWSSMTPALLGVKQPNDLCTHPFNLASPVPALPWPGPSATSVGPQLPCDKQRPAVNSTPAFSHNGKIYLVSTANHATAYAYLLRVNAATLAADQAISLRDRISDGCGRWINYGDEPVAGICRFGTPYGTDPVFGEMPAGRETGIMSVSPVVAPDGNVMIGSYSGTYNANMGHLHIFTSAGAKYGSPWSYGWEQTPSIFVRPDTGEYETRVGLNRFSKATGDGTDRTLDPNAFYAVASLNQYPWGYSSEWLAGFNIHDNPAGVVAYDWLDSQMAVDVAGNTYATNAMGRIVRIDTAGEISAVVDVGLSMETMSSASTFGVDGQGRPTLYVPYAGQIYIIGGGEASPHGALNATRSVPVTGTRHRGANVD